ncbi:hypothetical protein BALOs_2618 [Halobacteriovorax sp. BALOs_7]|uniref:hypothetical protein n=1 Tax=Halobacteriovorax sp. BALOs_7 TaxID=2109558 RepID=UPI000EA01BEA|nr:hypothetical protein [Halobacteriovorax sp. BALOs_7]AYF45612.1 hypothetical protein BALOs_2618 [Halobacteriovorax sp. BALOs_7]
MKKFFKLAAIAALSLSAYANILMPEISRDGKTRNESLMAVSQSSRNFIAGQLSTVNLEDDFNNEIDITTTSVYGGFSAESFTMEIGYDNANWDVGSADEDFKDISILAGFKVNERLTLGVGLETSELLNGVDDTGISFGGTLLVEGTVLGGTIARHTYELGSAEGDFILLTGAFGSATKDMSWETGITYQMEGSGDLNTGARLGIFGNATKISGAWEFDGSFNYTFGDYLDEATGDNDYSSIEIEFDAEYLLNKEFYITPGVNYTSVDYPDSDDDTELVSLNGFVGFRNSQGLDATFGLEYVLSGDIGGDDVDGLGWGINVGYVF